MGGRQRILVTCLYKPLEAERLVGIVEEISRRKLRAFLGEPFHARET